MTTAHSMNITTRSMAINSVKTICQTLEQIAPVRLAESWDNVGLLLEAPPLPVASQDPAKRVLLTIDLTTAVFEEALKRRVQFIVTYHTPIFRPLLSLTLAKPLQATLLRCARAGISVYSPHTALDSVRGGINDWLASGLAGGTPFEALDIKFIEEKDPSIGAGMGRVVNIPAEVTVADVVSRAKSHLGLQHVQVAHPQGQDMSRLVRSIAICAGGGGSVLRGVNADVYFTGEMAHHEVLAAVADGITVILCGHTNTERGYLPTLKEKLFSALSPKEGFENLDIFISTEDRHPLEIV